ncbi:MAG: hypothetical protein Q7T76_14970 [Ferruginibacter sp.]|nr:hypothetical protein [Ferruginibacter sp.]
MNIYHLASLLLFLLPFSCDQAFEFQGASSVFPASIRTHKTGMAAAPMIVIKSTDGGQTWQDISAGLPDPVKYDHGVDGTVFFANDNGIYLTDGNEIYHSKQNATAPFWTKEISPDERRSTSCCNAGISAYTYRSNFTQKINASGVCSPVTTNFQDKKLRTVFETAGGKVFIGTDNGFYKSTNSRTTGKMKLVESNGVLMSTTNRGIIRSTDDGENWDLVISEGGVGIAIEHIEGGFAAITYNTASETRRVRTSYDGGKTWQPIDAGLPATQSIASIIQVGENFFCGHPNGIFKSTDKGKTWKLVLPSINGKVFNLSVSGNVIYAIPRNGGC